MGRNIFCGCCKYSFISIVTAVDVDVDVAESVLLVVLPEKRKWCDNTDDDINIPW